MEGVCNSEAAGIDYRLPTVTIILQPSDYDNRLPAQASSDSASSPRGAARARAPR